MDILTWKTPKDFNLFCFGDDHEGTRLRHNTGWEQLIDMMHSPYGDLPESRNYGIDHGDIAECILIDDKRYAEMTQMGTVLQQIQRAIQHLRPIKNKLITILEGNHTWTLRKFGNITEHVCAELTKEAKNSHKIAYGPWQIIIDYTDIKGKYHFSQFATHGYKALNSTIDDPVDRKNSMLRSLRRQLQGKAGNTILMTMGHCHKLLQYLPDRKLGIVSHKGEIYERYDKSEHHHQDEFIPEDRRYYLACGSFLKTLGEGFFGYAEKAGYNPNEIGYQVVKIRDGLITQIDEIII